MNKVSLTTLGSLIEFQRGYDLPKTDFKNGIYPVQSSNGILGYHNEYKVKGPGITIGRSGTVGLPHLIQSNFFPHNTTLFIKDFKRNNIEYIFYLLKNLNLGEMKSGSGVPTINRNHLHPLKVIAYLNTNFQKSIATVLSSLDAKIELNNRINSELEQMARTLYNYWFVQFDFPGKNGKPYKTSGGKMVWNEELKREIPEGWEVKRLGKILKTVLGGTPSTGIRKYWQNGNYHWLNSGEIANFPIITSELKITKQAVEDSATVLMPKGTVAISITRHIRPSILAIDSCANQSVIGIYENDKYKNSFIYPLIRNEIPRYLTLRTGAQQPHINKQTVDNTTIILPNSNILESYYKIIEPIYNSIINNTFQNQSISELRDWLLPMLMNGQVKAASQVDNASYEIEEEISVAAEAEMEYGKVIRFEPKKCDPTETAILGGHIINLTNNENFGRVKFQKLLHLTSYKCKLDIGANFGKNVAGPHDGRLIKEIESTLQRYRFYNIKQSNYDNHKVNYTPLSAVSELEENYKNSFAAEANRIDAFLSKFKNSSWEQCEIVSTLYAVWNNRIIKKEEITDELLKQDFLAWDPKKKKYKNRLDGALQWMKDKEVVPDGWGKFIE